MRVTFTLTFVTISVICHCESRSVRDAIARVLSIVRSECGARGRTDTRRTRAASGIMQAGITTGRWGAATGLGQVWAGNARNNCVRCCPRKGERHRSAFLPRPRKPGLKSRAAGESPHVRAAVERRQASCPLLYPPPHAGEDMEGGSGRASCTAGWSKRLPAFRFPFFLSCFDQCKQTVSQFIIAGLDPAIHAEVKRDRTLGSYLASRTSLWTTGSSPVATREIVAV